MMPAGYLAWLIKVKPHRPFPDPNFVIDEKRPAIRTTAGTFKLLPEWAMTDSVHYLGEQPMVESARQYSAYVTSSRFAVPLDESIENESVLPLPPVVVHQPRSLTVRNQGDRLTCVAHAALAALEMRKDIPSDLSEEYAYHMFMINEHSNCCADLGLRLLDGGWYLTQHGVPEEDVMMYRDLEPNCGGRDDCHDPAHAEGLPAAPFLCGIKRLEVIKDEGFNDPLSIRNPAYLEAILAAGQDIAVGIRVAWSSDHPNGENAKGIIDVSIQQGANQVTPSVGGHALLFVGYNHNERFFIARNSFGAEWGSFKGDAHISYDYMTTYGVFGFVVDDVTIEPPPPPPSPPLPRPLSSSHQPGPVELVGEFRDARPAAVAISRDGRVFMSFSRADDSPPIALAEYKSGRVTPYPNKWIQSPRSDRMAMERLIGVRGLAIDGAQRLWIVDTGSLRMRPTTFGGPKLLAIDLAHNVVVKRIVFPEITIGHHYLNDIKIDTHHGREGYAFISESAGTEGGSIIVVDLATGKSWRRLEHHSSLEPDAAASSIVHAARWGADGIALSPDGERLYYCALLSKRIYSVSALALEDTSLSDAAVVTTLQDHGEKPLADGLEMSESGQLYLAEFSSHVIGRGIAGGPYTPIAFLQPGRPHTIALSRDGYLYTVVQGGDSALIERIRVDSELP